MPRGKLNWHNYYKWAAHFHVPIGEMTLFEFMSAVRGYAEANGVKPKGGSIDESRLSEMGIVGF